MKSTARGELQHAYRRRERAELTVLRPENTDVGKIQEQLCR